MVAKDLMRKYKYGYIHSCELLEEPFVKDLLKENQELKDKISNMQESYETDAEAKFYDYLGKHESKLEKENQELKKQLEEANKKLYLCTPEIPQNVHGKYVSYVDLINEMYELKKQQQEFINYLEDEIQSCEAVSDLLFNSNKEMKVYKEILTKYKEIVNGTEQN